MPVKIVSDSGCDLPPEIVAEYDIHLVPLVLRFGQRVVFDSAEAREELWQRVEQGLPCDTSGPAVGPYEELFGTLVAAGHQVVCVTLTGAYSVTYNSAWAAAQAYPDHVEVIDGRSISMGCGLQVWEAARLAAAGADRQTIVAAVNDLRQRLMVRFFFESLEQAKRGGRLEGLMPVLSRLGQVLNVRGVLTITDEGRFALVGPARGRRGAIKRVIEDALATAPVEQVVVAHTRCLDDALTVADALAEGLSFPRAQVTLVEIGAVLVAHAGQGVIGVGTVRQR
jgi:DegV family protein with EDD domain